MGPTNPRRMTEQIFSEPEPMDGARETTERLSRHDGDRLPLLRQRALAALVP